MYETRVVRVYYDAEQTRLKEEYFEVRGKREGPCRGYHSSGYLAVHTNYVAGQRVGSSIRYYPSHSNITMVIVNYKNGVLDGKATFYNEKGQLVRSANYVNNILEGVQLEYFDNGQLRRQSTYCAGKLIDEV